MKIATEVLDRAVGPTCRFDMLEGDAHPCTPGFDAAFLQRHAADLTARCAALEQQAVAMLGRPFCLRSASQLAAVLYGDLGLPPPTGNAGRYRLTHLALLCIAQLDTKCFEPAMSCACHSPHRSEYLESELTTA